MKNKCTKFRNYRPYTAQSLGTWKMFDNPTDNHTDIEVPLYYELRFTKLKTCDHCSSPRLLLSTNRVIKCRYLVNHTGIYLYIWGSVLAQLFYVLSLLCSVIMCLLTSWWTNIVRRLIQVQFSYLIYWFSHKLHRIFVIHTVSSFKTIFYVFWYLNR